MSDPDLEQLAAHAETVREKYESERQKRLRAEGNAQYIPLKEVKDFDADPFTPLVDREALILTTDVVIVGAGWGGMTAAAHLTQNGVNDFLIVDKAGDFGGTWYWNRYPGCMCDVESYTYLPFLEETGYVPTQKYAKAPEIFAYAQLLGRHFELYPRSVFQTEVVDAIWDDDTRRWDITTSRGDQISSRFFVICGGVLHKAKLPNIPGITDFEGEAFHTSRWDYSVTGGGPQQQMDMLSEKVVGIIGTGATAVQAVPKLAEASKQLFVFQRTASTIGPRNQRDTDPEWFAEISGKPGWQQERMENFSDMTTGRKPPIDLVQDAWTDLLNEDLKRIPNDAVDAENLELLNVKKMDELRERIDRIVVDNETAERLKPWYKVGCKRPCFHDEYLPAFNRDNVTLVDTDGHGVERVTNGAVVANGREYPVDVLVFASGFELLSFYTHRLGFDPKGEDGVPLSEAWAHGPSTLFGTNSRGFPNMFMNSPIQGGQDINFSFPISQASKQIAYIISEVLKRSCTKVEPTLGAQDGWFGVIAGTVLPYGTYLASCTPSYLNNESAAPTDYEMRIGAYMGSVRDWLAILEAWRQAGDLDGLELQS